MRAYSFTPNNGAHPAQLAAAIAAHLPGAPQCSWHDNGTFQALYDDGGPTPTVQQLDQTTSAITAIPAYDVWLANQTVDLGHIEIAVDAAAATITADTQQTTVTDSRIDLLEQQLAVALAKLADLASYVDSQNV